MSATSPSRAAITLDQPHNLGPDGLRAVFGRFPSGVVAVCAEVDGVREAMIASSFVSVSLDPPLVAFCPQNSSTTWPRLSQATRLGVSVLGEGQVGIARSMSAKDSDRFDGVDVHDGADGALLLHGASAWYETSIEHSYPAGDHQIVLLRIHAASTSLEPPTVFHRSRFERLTPPARP